MVFTAITWLFETHLVGHLLLWVQSASEYPNLIVQETWSIKKKAKREEKEKEQQLEAGGLKRTSKRVELKYLFSVCVCSEHACT